MVQLDHRLLHRARQLTTGANVHRMKELIFVYKQAVLLHNGGSTAHVIYQEKFEKELRQFTKQQTVQSINYAIPAWHHGTQLGERNIAVREHARKALARAQRVHAQCDQLDERVTTALSLSDATSSSLLDIKNIKRGRKAA